MAVNAPCWFTIEKAANSLDISDTPELDGSLENFFKTLHMYASKTFLHIKRKKIKKVPFHGKEPTLEELCVLGETLSLCQTYREVLEDMIGNLGKDYKKIFICIFYVNFLDMESLLVRLATYTKTAGVNLNLVFNAILLSIHFAIILKVELYKKRLEIRNIKYSPNLIYFEICGTESTVFLHNFE